MYVMSIYSRWLVPIHIYFLRPAHRMVSIPVQLMLGFNVLTPEDY